MPYARPLHRGQECYPRLATYAQAIETPLGRGLLYPAAEAKCRREPSMAPPNGGALTSLAMARYPSTRVVYGISNRWDVLWFTTITLLSVSLPPVNAGPMAFRSAFGDYLEPGRF